MYILSLHCTYMCKIKQLSSRYKVIQIWPGRFVSKQVTVCPGHIWTTLYIHIKVNAIIISWTYAHVVELMCSVTISTLMMVNWDRNMQVQCSESIYICLCIMLVSSLNSRPMCYKFVTSLRECAFVLICWAKVYYGRRKVAGHSLKFEGRGLLSLVCKVSLASTRILRYVTQRSFQIATGSDISGDRPTTFLLLATTWFLQKWTTNLSPPPSTANSLEVILRVPPQLARNSSQLCGVQAVCLCVHKNAWALEEDAGIVQLQWQSFGLNDRGGGGGGSRSIPDRSKRFILRKIQMKLRVHPASSTTRSKTAGAST
jgi:hypothetical protein